MKVEIYIEVSEGIYERLDMFEDESIQMKYKLKDTTDIGKIFSTYSQTFTIPSSSKNQRVLNYFFSTEVARSSKKYIKAKIYISSELFKTGLISINETKLKTNQNSSISINFFTGIKTLKDIIGDDTISDLNMDPILFQYNDTNVYNTIVSGTTGSDFLIPLASINRVWGLSTPIKKEELRPAIKFSNIMDAIISKYSLDINAPIFTEDMYTKLYVWGTGKGLEQTIQLDIQNQFYLENPFEGTNRSDPEPTIIVPSADTTSNIITINKVNPNWNRGAFFQIDFLDVVSLFDGDEEPTITVDLIDKRPSSSTFNQILLTLPFEKDGTQYSGKFDLRARQVELNFGPSNPLIFTINANFNIPISFYYYRIRTIEVGGNEYGQSDDYQEYRSDNPPSSGVTTINLASFVPDIKVIDFLSSFYKMFNINVRQSNTSATLNYERPQDFIGLEKDYTPYVDIEETTIKTAPFYKKYIFQHNESDYNSNVNWRKANVNNPNSKEYGQVIWTSPDEFAKDEYKVETKFTIIPAVLVPGTNVQTFYGFDDSQINDLGLYTPNLDEFTIFYHNGVKDITRGIGITGESINMLFKINTTDTPFNKYNKFSIVDNDFVDTNGNLVYTNSLGFKDEVTIGSNYFVLNKNLFSNFYSGLVSRIENNNTRIFNYKVVLPPSEINNFDLRDTLIIGNDKFTIEEADINIVDGTGKLTLMNIAPVRPTTITYDDIFPPIIPTIFDAQLGLVTNTIVINTDWYNAFDNVEIKGYEISSRISGTTTWTAQPFITTNQTFGSYAFSGVSPSNDYEYRLRVRDTSDNWSVDYAYTNFSYIDVIEPLAPLNFYSLNEYANQLELHWDNAYDDLMILGYEISYKKTSDSTYSTAPFIYTNETFGEYFLIPLDSGEDYNVRIRTRDADMNWSTGYTSIVASTATPIDFLRSIDYQTEFDVDVCDVTRPTETIYGTKRINDILVGDKFYNDIFLSTTFSGGSFYWRIGLTTFKSYRINDDGEVLEIVSCPIYSYPYFRSATSLPAGSIAGTCILNFSTNEIHLPDVIANASIGDYVYANAALTTKFNGGGLAWLVGETGDRYGFTISNLGVITNIYVC